MHIEGVNGLLLIDSQRFNRTIIGMVFLIMVLFSFLISLPVNSDNVQLGFYNAVAYNFSKALLGEETGEWHIYKRWNGKFDVIGLLDVNRNENKGLVLVKLFGFHMPDSFTAKPVAIEDLFVKMQPNIDLALNVKNNYLVIGKPSSINLLGPMKYGAMGFYMSVYSYRRIELLSVKVLSGSQKGLNITTYKDLESYLDNLKANSTLLFTVKVHPTETNVILVGDSRYGKWDSYSLDCDGAVLCEGKKYLAGWFSMLYETPKLPPRGEEPETINYYGMILTPFYNMTTWTYNPDYQYFVGSGIGIAWNDSCKYNNYPTPKDKYILKWMGPGDINELYALRIMGHPDDPCCHLPAYYVNFLPKWCEAGKKVGNVFNYNVSKVIDRVRHVPLGSASAYIPGTGVNVVYSNGKMYFFEMKKPGEQPVQYVSLPMVLLFNTTMRWNYTMPENTPELEKAVVPVDFGSVRNIWFTSNLTMVVLGNDGRTLHLYLYNEPIDKNPSAILNPVTVKKITLKQPVSKAVENGSIVYLTSKDGVAYRINGIRLTKMGVIDSSPLDIGVFGRYLAVLYNNKIVLYNVNKGLKKEYEVPLNNSYKWIVTSTNYIFLIGDNYTSVYTLEPKTIFLSGPGVGKALVTAKPHESTGTSQKLTPSTSRATESSGSVAVSENRSLENTSRSETISKSGAAVAIAGLIIIFLVGYYYFRNK